MKKFAIIGCGRIAHRHAEQAQRVGTLVAVCDSLPEKADAFAKQYNTSAYYSIEDLLKDAKSFDILSVCTPNGYHAEHTIKALQARVHVLAEKPMCLTTAAAWQVIETEKFCRRTVFVVKSTRFNPLLIQLKKFMDDGLLGKVYSLQLACNWNRSAAYYTDWRGKNFPDGGTLYTQFSHYIDAMLWLFGDVTSIAGFRTNAAHQQAIEFEDTGAVAMQLQSGALATLHWSVNTFQKNHEIGFTIIAEKATIQLGGEYLQEVKYVKSETAMTFSIENEQANDYQFYKGSMSNHLQVYDQLITALENPGSHYTGAYDGLKTVNTIERIYAAAPIV